jgi:RNase P subunit RPR2
MLNKGIPTSMRVKFCSYCSTFFIPSINCNVRITTKKDLTEEELKLLSLFLKVEEEERKQYGDESKYASVKNVVV